MPDKKKQPLDDATPKGQEVPFVSSSIGDSSIPSDNKKSQGTSPKKSKKQHNSKMLYPQSWTRSMAVKVNEEQLPNGSSGDEKIHIFQDKVAKVPKDKLQIIAIVHYKDIAKNSDIWAPASEKWHLHVWVRGVNRTRFNVAHLLNYLGIVFRPGTDDILWENHGCETVTDFTACAMYATHETPDALADGGKETYDIEDIITNLSLEELKQVRAGYTRVSENASRLSADDKADLDKAFFDLGYNFGNLQEMINSQPFAVRDNSSRKTWTESYNRGIEQRIDDDKQNRRQLARVCVFIEGEPATGKTYSSVHALDGLKILQIEGAGTGKYDDLRPYTDAIICNDDNLPFALNVSDDYPIKLYKRGNNNQVWAGRWLIVTSNKNFETWCKEDCNLKNDEHIKAMKTRFFICHMMKSYDHWQLYCDAPASRGDPDILQKKLDDFGEFQEKFNDICRGFTPAESALDFSMINKSNDLSDDEIYHKYYEYMTKSAEHDVQIYPELKNCSYGLWNKEQVMQFIEDENYHELQTVEYTDKKTKEKIRLYHPLSNMTLRDLIPKTPKQA